MVMIKMRHCRVVAGWGLEQLHEPAGLNGNNILLQPANTNYQYQLTGVGGSVAMWDDYYGLHLSPAAPVVLEPQDQ